jgi:hypothetical protein
MTTSLAFPYGSSHFHFEYSGKYFELYKEHMDMYFGEAY